MPQDQTFDLIPQEGLILARRSPFATPQGFSTLTNARLVPSRGRIEQTPYFMRTTYSAGTYYSGGVQTEASTAQQYLVVGYKDSSGTSAIFSLGTIARSGGSQVQIIRQTAFPSGTTAQKQLLAVINNYTSLGLTLGSTLDVVIDSATTFKWRKNGGAYTTGVAITSAVTIDSGNVTLYFLATTGFTVSDTWSWQRTDYGIDPGGSATLESPPSYIVGDSIYFIDPSGRVMKFENGGIRSVGYQPIYGSSLTVHEKHLVIGGYSATLYNHVNATPSVVAISDLDNLDNFFPTDTNEADTFTLVGERILGNVDQGNGVWRVSVIRNVLYAYTPTEIWGTQYSGLPVPYSFTQVVTSSFHSSFRGTPFNDGGDYVVLTNGIAYFDGNTIRNISAKVQDLFLNPAVVLGLVQNTYTQFTWGFYDFYRHEVYFYYRNQSGSPYFSSRGFLVYQEDTDTWYFRAAHFAVDIHSACTASTINPASITIGYPLGYLTEDLTGGGGGSTMMDYGTGTSYQLPTIELYRTAFAPLTQVLEYNQGYVDASYTTASDPYATTGISVELSFRDRYADTPSYVKSDTWTTSRLTGNLSFRASGRILQLRIKPIVTTNKVPFGFSFNSIHLQLKGLDKVKR